MVQNEPIKGTGRCVRRERTCKATVRGLAGPELVLHKDHWVSQKRHDGAVRRYQEKPETLRGFEIWNEYLVMRGFHPTDIGRLKKSAADRHYASHRTDKKLLKDIETEFGRFKDFVEHMDIRRIRESPATRREVHFEFFRDHRVLPPPMDMAQLEEEAERRAPSPEPPVRAGNAFSDSDDEDGFRRPSPRPLARRPPSVPQREPSAPRRKTQEAPEATEAAGAGAGPQEVEPVAIPIGRRFQAKSKFADDHFKIKKRDVFGVGAANDENQALYVKFLKAYFTEPAVKEWDARTHEERLIQAIPTAEYRKTLTPLIYAWLRIKDGLPLQDKERRDIWTALKTVSFTQHRLTKVRGDW